MEIDEIEQEEKQKNEIIINYLPDLSVIQRVSFFTKNKKVEQIILLPNVNYNDESGKGFYIFYNNNLNALKILYYSELIKLMDDHPFVLFHIKDFLTKLDLRYDEEIYFTPIRLISRLISYYYQPIVDKARSIAKNIIKIEEIKELSDNDNKKEIFEVKVSDDKEGIFNDLICIKKNDYEEIENKFKKLFNENKDNLSYVDEMEKALDEFLEKIGENNLDRNIINTICFIFNRASYYLKYKEKMIFNMDLKLLKKFDKLRKKINSGLLKYRFKYEKYKKPILNIQIESYIILSNTLETTSIYVEKLVAKKFIAELKDSLERRDNNLINILKLYHYLNKRKYDSRNDYSGLIITENRTLNNNLEEETNSIRRYEIYEISM